MHAQRSWLRPLGPAHVREGFRHRPLRSSPLTSEYRHARAALPSEVRSLCWRLLSFEGIQTVRWHRTRTSSRFALALSAMLVAPFLEQIWSVGEAAHHAVDVSLSDGLQNNTAKLVFQKLDLSAGGDPVFAAEFRRNHELALRGECSTCLFHNLHITTSTTYTIGELRHAGNNGTSRQSRTPSKTARCGAPDRFRDHSPSQPTLLSISLTPRSSRNILFTGRIGSSPASCSFAMRSYRTTSTAALRLRQWYAGIYTNLWQWRRMTGGTVPSSAPKTYTGFTG